MSLLIKTDRWQSLATQIPGIEFLLTFNSRRHNKITTHHYNYSDIGCEFVLDSDPERIDHHQMTAQKGGVKPGDCIRIHNSVSITDYQIIEIEYFCEPSDMWIAKLREIQY